MLEESPSLATQDSRAGCQGSLSCSGDPAHSFTHYVHS